MRTLPYQLQNPDFRFFLVQGNTKDRPIEKKYNTDNNYPFFHPKVQQHLSQGGNLGILTGIAGLIVIDFDSREYYKKYCTQLPWTFCVRTANKRLYHLYYYLEGEMFNTVGVDVDGKRACDIMGAKGKVICPPSTLDRKYYQVVTDVLIATITLDQIKAIFNIVPKKPVVYTGVEFKTDNKAVALVIEILAKNGIKRSKERHFHCPFHDSEGGSCLWVNESGLLHCFHCKFHGNIHDFIDRLNAMRGIVI